MKTVKIVALGFVAVVAVAVLALVWGIPAGFLVATVQNRVEADTGYRLRIDGSTRIGLWPAPTVSVRDISLTDRNDPDRQARFQADDVRASVSFGSLFTGSPRVTEIVVVRPVARVPLARERGSAPPASGVIRTSSSSRAINVDRISVENGSVVFTGGRNRDEGRIDSINLSASLANNRVDVKGSARMGDKPLRVEVKGETTGQRLEGQTVPLEWIVEAPGILQEPLAAVADLRYAGSLLNINGLRGTIGRNRFTGFLTVDMASNKPLLKGDFDFQKLELGTAQPSGRAAPAAGGSWDQPWSDRELSLDSLNYLDADLRFSAAELSLDAFRVGPISIEATVNRGLLNASFSRVGLYSGQGNGSLVVDTAGQTPAHVLKIDLDGVTALPLLTEVADFTYLDGRMQAKIDVRATGASPRAIMSTLGGSAELTVQDGELRGVNVAKMIRGLTSSIMNGWQESGSEKTDLSLAAALFRIDRGQAKTDNMRLLGPLVRVTGGGNLDLVAKTMQFKVEPKLVASLQGQGGPDDALGFGVPVRIEGPWSAPKFYPDVAGILDNPDAAYSRLRQIGSGLFGGTGTGGSGTGGQSGNSIDQLLQGLGNFNRPGTNTGRDSQPGQGTATAPTDRKDPPPAERRDSPPAERRDTQQSDRKDPPAQTTDRQGGTTTDPKDLPKTPTPQEVMKTLNDLFGSGGQGGQGGQSPGRDLLRDLFGR